MSTFDLIPPTAPTIDVQPASPPLIQTTPSSGSGSSLPDQSGHAGQYLRTNGSVASWQEVISGRVTTDPQLVSVSGSWPLTYDASGIDATDLGLAFILATTTSGVDPADLHFDLTLPTAPRDPVAVFVIADGAFSLHVTPGDRAITAVSTDSGFLIEALYAQQDFGDGISWDAYGLGADFLGASGPPLSDATPQSIGTAGPGTSPDASRADHIHDATTAAIPDSTNRRYVTDAELVVIGNTSGTNTGNQTISLTGDVTGSGTGSFTATIADGVVTNAKAADMANKTYKGRHTAGTAAPEDVSVANVMADLSGAAAADFSLNSHKLTSVTDPSSPQDAATKNYVDTATGLLVPKSLFDANTMLYATTDDTPVALTIAASRVVGRKSSGDIAALTGAEALAITGGIADPGGSNDDLLQRKSGAWANRTPAQVGADLPVWPRKVSIANTDYPSSVTGTWTFNQSSSMISGGYFATAATADQAITWLQLSMSAGTWAIDVWTRDSTNCGIITVKLGGSSIGTVDTYAGTLATNVRHSLTGITVSANAYYDLELSNPTKNASSSAFLLGIVALVFRRTGP